MKRMTRLLGCSVLAASIAGGGAAQAAFIGSVPLTDADGRWMTSTSTLAGSGDYSDINGTLAESSFRTPVSLTVLANGDLAVADSYNNQIRLLTGGQAEALAGSSILKDNKGIPIGYYHDGKSDEAFFNRPGGIAADGQGNLYVADTENNAIRIVEPDGTVRTIAGSGNDAHGHIDGKGTEARFHHPKDVAVAADGTVYVADTLNHLIRKIAADGTVTTLNAASTRVVEVHPGYAVPAGDFADGELKAALFNEPSGLALDAEGNLYVSDSGNQRIRYIDFAAGRVTTAAGGNWAESGAAVYENSELHAASDFADGPAAQARFDFPAGLAVTPEGGLLIADSMNHSVRYLKDGMVRTLAGSAEQAAGEADGIEGDAELHAPTDVAVTAEGTVLVADAFNNKLRSISLYERPASLPTDGGIQVVFEDTVLDFEAEPEIVDGRTMAPVRAVAEALGYQVVYGEADRSVSLTNGTVSVRMSIGKNGVTRNEGERTDIQSVDAAPYIRQDLTYVPIRFFAEQLGFDVQWFQEWQTAVIRKKTHMK